MRLRAERVADVSRGECRELTRLSFVEYAAQWIASYAGRGKAKALTEDELHAVLEAVTCMPGRDRGRVIAMAKWSLSFEPDISSDRPRHEGDEMIKLFAVATLAAIAAASVAALATRSEATAAGSGDPRIAVLQTQVKALQTQVKTLTKGLSNLNGQIQVNFSADTCLAAQTADLFQGTWGVVDQVAQVAQQKTYFGPQTQTNDYGNCAQLTSPSVPRGPVAIPPTINPLLPLMQWLHE